MTRRAADRPRRNAHITQHDAAWWAARPQRNFAYLEPVRMRSKRRAAFKTWPSKPGRDLRNLTIFLREENKHQLGKRRR